MRGCQTLSFGASHVGDAQAVAAWLDEGGGVDAGCAEQAGATLLMGAAVGGQETMVHRSASVNLQDSCDLTALMAATANGHTTIVCRRCSTSPLPRLLQNSSRYKPEIEDTRLISRAARDNARNAKN